MRVVVAIKSTGGQGAARATRYISERDRDTEREGEGPRPLFSEREEPLTYRKADQVLSRGHSTPDKDDLIHLSVSFQPEDFERLGETDKERKARLREVTLESLGGLKDDLGASEWRWIAGIHLNTEHPHLHILISKEIIDRETEQPRRLGRIPKRLLPHREPDPHGTMRPVEGNLGNHFIAALDRHIEHAREIAEFNKDTERENVAVITPESISREQFPMIEELKEVSQSSPATFTKLVSEHSTPSDSINFSNEPLVRVSRRHPCPVCNKPTWCAVSQDGTRAICMRVPSPRETRNGGYLHIMSQSLDPAYRQVSRLVEVVQIERASIEQRNEAYQALLDAISLNERDKSNLLMRGLDEAAIARNGYRSVPSPTQAAMAVQQVDPNLLAGVPGFYREDGVWRLNLDNWHQGFLIPVRDEAGRIEGFQIRRVESDPRYIWLSSNNRPEGASSGAPIHYCNVSRMREQGEAVITEGALKADIIAHYLDRGVISVQGVMSFPTDFGQRLKEKIPEIKQVSIAFDADSARKPEVQRARGRLEQTLRQAGINVTLLKWPERDGKGFDDFLQAKLGRDFTSVLQTELRERQIEILREVGWIPFNREQERSISAVIADEHKSQSHISTCDGTKKVSSWLRKISDAHSAVISWSDGSRGDSVGEHFAQSELLIDRLILGEAIAVDARREYAQLSYEKAIRSGEAFRFQVRDDSTGELRQISELDVRRRADARGQRAASESDVYQANERREIRQQVSTQNIARHSMTLDTLRDIRDKVIAKLEREASIAERHHAVAQANAHTVREKYQARGEDPPLPLINRDTFVELQDQAIRYGLPERIASLEQLRIALSREHNLPARTDAETARVAAHYLIEESELAASRERATSFDYTRHLQQWEIGNERWSLVDLDRAIARQTDESRFFGKYRFHFAPGERRRASEEAARLTEVRAEVVKQIEDHRLLLHNEVEQAQKKVDVLTRIYQSERASRAQDGRPLPEPEFTREEIKRISANAETTRDAGLLRQLNDYEKQIEGRGLSAGVTDEEQRLPRALAREIIAEINLRESSERLKSYEERLGTQPLAISEADGHITIHTLKETELHSVIQRMLRPFLEVPADRERRDRIQAASVEYHNRLVSEFEKSRAYYQTAHEIVAEIRGEMSLHDGSEKLVEPAFTAKERINLEIYAERQTDPQVREHYLQLARGESNEQHQVRDSHSHHSFEQSRMNAGASVHSFFARSTGRGR